MKNSKIILSITALIFIYGCSKKTLISKDVLSAPKVTASAKELARVTDDVLPEFQPNLSPNGLHLLYVVRDDAKSGFEKWSIRLKKDLSQPGFTPLIGSKTESPSWINDNKFSFTYFSPKSIIATSSLDKLGISYLGQNNFGDHDRFASISPDKTKYILETKLNNNNNICLVNENGSNFTILSEGSNPYWHPSGEFILYQKKSGDIFQLFELNLNTYQSTQLTTGEKSSFEGKYSPDGNFITFISNADNNDHLFIIERTGFNKKQLTSGDYRCAQPFWGSDGYIYFSTNAGARKPEKARETKTNSFTYADIWRLKPLTD